MGKNLCVDKDSTPSLPFGGLKEDRIIWILGLAGGCRYNGE